MSYNLRRFIFAAVIGTLLGGIAIGIYQVSQKIQRGDAACEAMGGVNARTYNGFACVQRLPVREEE